MKYSVIVPVYNAENDINRCLTSLIKQEYMNFEIIIIDDGSTDTSLEKCMEFKEKYENQINIVVKSVKNGGPGYARNIGVRIASGKKILFVDADDIVDNSYFCVLEKYSQKDFDILCFGMEHHQGYDTIKKYSELNCITGEKIFNRFIEVYLGKGDLCSVINKCYDKEFLQSNNILFPENSVVEEDLIFNLRSISVAKSIKTIPEILYHYLCKESNSATTSYNPRKFELKKQAYIEEIEIAHYWENSQLIQLFQNNYLIHISAAINNLFYKKCNLKKKERLKKINDWFNDDITKNVISSVRCNKLRSRIMYYLIKYKWVRLSYFIHYIFNIRGRK